jgi:hypothetical protein
MKLTENDIKNIVKILDNQTVAINNLSKRLVEAEILIASMTDLIIDKGVISNEDLLEIMNKKIDIVKVKLDFQSKLDKLKKEDTEIIESYPYFGEKGEA